MKKLLLILLLFAFNSCVTNYYFVNIDEDASIYASKEGTELIATIPKGSGAYINSSDKKIRKIKWRNYKGWVINPVYSNASMSNNSTNYNSQSSSSSSSSYKSSPKASSGGTVHVKGYTRKNGTYVQPHTRSTPRRK